jgi:hypothetical protein
VAKRKCIDCPTRFVAKNWRHRRCASCAKKKAFARLAAYNYRRRYEGADVDRRRGPDIRCICGTTYAGFRVGLSFLDARRDFITDDPNRRTGKRRHGRRNAVLGKMREWKQLAWKAHVAECAAAAV